MEPQRRKDRKVGANDYSPLLFAIMASLRFYCPWNSVFLEFRRHRIALN
jgi:hypothetical protein